MENKKCKIWANMATIFSLFNFICMFSYSPAMAHKLAILPSIEANEKSSLETYIVHVNKPKGVVFTESESLANWYESFLPVGPASLNQQRRMVYSYKNVFTGFAARLTVEEVKAMEKKDGFLSAKPEKIFSLQTTHTPLFLGLHQDTGFWKDSNFGKGVIIGMLDTGIYPEHPSFSDAGMPPPPAKWKGKCEFNGTACNNKLIGARNFVTSMDGVTGPPNDDAGHGTHTASTAAGNFVEGANVYGLANGTAVGIAPYAHLAMYKVCDYFCAESDILAAMDTAIEDGVDVLSLSLGGGSSPFHADGIALGAFSAMQQGIFVSCSAGNSGPENGTLSNEAPWILTVGASTVDRNIRATAQLGNKEEFDGESFYQPKDFPPTLLPLVYAGANGNASSAFCAPGSLQDVDVKGKVVLCERGGAISRIGKGLVVKEAGGAAMILMNDELNGESVFADAHVLPATNVGYSEGLKIKAYINSTSTPTATIIFKGTVIGNPLAPMVAFFSSRGPSLASPGILKPDIIGPGVSILAAWPFPLDNSTNSKLTFNMISGTSMSCPHLSGVAALLKSSHPDWSPAAIKSAIMTSADVLNLGNKPIIDQAVMLPADILATGAGHVNPSRANNPGLIYDIQPDDYIPYLCGLGYSNREVTAIAQRKVNCSAELSIPEAQLNYPSFSIVMGSNSQTISRTATNVGEASSSYTLEIVAPEGVSVSVEPGKLDFTAVNQKMTYKVTFSPTSTGRNPNKPFAQGSLKWVSAKNFVRMPILVQFT